MRRLYALEKAALVLLVGPLVLLVIGGLAYSLITGASARASGGAVGAFVAGSWPYLLGGLVLVLIVWGAVERVLRR